MMQPCNRRKQRALSHSHPHRRVQGTASVITYLRLLLREFHIVKNPEHDSEQVLPPVLFKGVTVALHDLKHDRESSGGTKSGAEREWGGGRGKNSREERVEHGVR